MFKKVLIAGLAVAVGVALLAVVCPSAREWMAHWWKEGAESIANSVPLEEQLSKLKGDVDALKQNERKYYDMAAKQWKDVENQRKEVDVLTANLDELWNKEILPLKTDLDTTQKTSFGPSKIPTRASAEADLTRKFKRYEDLKQELNNKKDVLAESEEALTETEKNLATLSDQRKEMVSQLKQLEARLNKVKAKEARSSVPGSDNDYAKVRADIQALRDKLDIREKSEDYREKFGDKPEADSSPSSPSTAPAEKTDFKDTMKKIDEENARRSGGNVVDQK
jgi:chromosome segregation ATPase